MGNCTYTLELLEPLTELSKADVRTLYLEAVSQWLQFLFPGTETFIPCSLTNVAFRTLPCVSMRGCPFAFFTSVLQKNMRFLIR